MLVIIIGLVAVAAVFLSSLRKGADECLVRTATAIVIAAIVCYLTIWLGAGLWPDYSNGEKSGTVVEFRKKGWFIKTWEGTMHKGGTADSSGNKPWDFSVNDPKVIEKIKELQGKPVSLTYREWGVQAVTDGSTDYEVIAVKEVK